VGALALPTAQTTSSNTAVGADALFSLGAAGGDRNVAVGAGALDSLATGSRNIAIGPFAGDLNGSGSDNIYIGNRALGSESDVVRIGTAGFQNAVFLAGVNGVTSVSGVPVFVNSDGQLGTATSSRRFKEDVESMGEASDGLLRLRPVTFRYKAPYDDGSHLLQYGLIAEEVAAVYPGLVQYDENGAPLAVRYQFLSSMLLNEVQKQEARIEKLEAALAALQGRGCSAAGDR
jgi:hypothetical protein